VILENTAKPVGVVAFGRESARQIIDMAAVVAGGMENLTKRPTIQLLCEPISPLKLDQRQGENLVEFARHKLPIEMASMPAMCSTAPATLAGTVAQVNAEHLCMIVIAQLVNAGTPVSLNACTGCLDPRTGTNAYGAVERVLLNAAVAQLWRSFYGIETYASAALTDSKVPDQQAGYERMMNMLLPVLVGVDMITTLGYLESYLTISSEQVLIDNEIASMILRILGGVKVNDESLAVDVIGKVGPGHHFLSEKHTLNHVGELFMPKLANRSPRGKWRRAGEKDIARVARDEAKLILKTHQPEPLEKSIQDRLRKMAER
jgi:trimethylamine--corrinoid protein Co-methyltransferase